MRPMYRIFGLLWLASAVAVSCGEAGGGDDYRFDLAGAKKGYTAVMPETVYGAGAAYGYDLGMVQDGAGGFFFSVDLPEGNYVVTTVTGSPDTATDVTVKSESRRIMAANVRTAPGEYAETVFAVNIRNKAIDGGDSVRINPREVGKLIWDDKLTLEFSGVNPSVREIRIRRDDNLPTIFIAGNSTVVDEGKEPWTGWGQVFPLFTTAEVAVANYAESGQAANTFVSSRRFDKLMTKMKPGDWLIIEFGHNDQKQQGEGKGAYESFTNDLKFLADGFREGGGNVVFITPVQRRHFDADGALMHTHGDHPDAMRKLAAEEGLPLIDLTEMTTRLYEAWGPEESKRAFVHYPAGTFPEQETDLEDNTHFNPYGGYQIAKCVVQGIVEQDLPLKRYIRTDFAGFDPSRPDAPEEYTIPATPLSSMSKPLGN
ncbi:MAG: rhamnogalacturonan acetylesterase [Alistipes sp.]|nr:rhamnogalacturonan acetylesterase [Alistipes sp.]